MTDPEAPRKTSFFAKVVMGFVALVATLGYLVAIAPDYWYEAAVLLNVGFGIFLLLLWVSAFRGPLRNWKLSFGVALVAFGLIIAGALNMDRAQQRVWEALNRIRYERLALSDGQRVSEDRDPFGQELVRAFDHEQNINRTTFGMDWSRRNALVPLIEEKRPGWPRALYQFVRQSIVEMPKRDANEDSERSAYGVEPRMGCGHYWANSTVFGFTNYRYLSYALSVEERLMARALLDREDFLKAWKKLKPEERGEEIGK